MSDTRNFNRTFVLVGDTKSLELLVWQILLDLWDLVKSYFLKVFLSNHNVPNVKILLLLSLFLDLIFDQFDPFFTLFRLLLQIVLDQLIDTCWRMSIWQGLAVRQRIAFISPSWSIVREAWLLFTGTLRLWLSLFTCTCSLLVLTQVSLFRTWTGWFRSQFYYSVKFDFMAGSWLVPFGMALIDLYPFKHTFTF